MDRMTRDEYGLVLAFTAALRSEDPYRQVGACLMRGDGTVISLGYNGAPPSVAIDWSDRDARRMWVIHAEANALRFARPEEAATLYVTSIPCEKCILMVAAYQIHRVVYRDLLDPAVYDHDVIFEISDRCDIELVQLGGDT